VKREVGPLAPRIVGRCEEGGCGPTRRWLAEVVEKGEMGPLGPNLVKMVENGEVG
jgi:hypothetical protein